jgi:hypothetical protein
MSISSIGANIMHFKTFPYVSDIISPTGHLIAVDVSKDAVKIQPSCIVTLSPQALSLGGVK